MISHFVVRCATRQFRVLRGLVSWSNLHSCMWYHLWKILQLSLNYSPYSGVYKWFCLSTWITFSRIVIYFSSCKCCAIVDGLPSQCLLHRLMLWTKGHWTMGLYLWKKKNGMKSCISILISYSTSVNKSVLNSSIGLHSNNLISYVGFISDKCFSTWYPTWVPFVIIELFYRIRESILKHLFFLIIIFIPVWSDLSCL